jgi:hypothetical protein
MSWLCILQTFDRFIGGPTVGIYCIDRSQTHECVNWDWGRAIPFLGIHKSKCLCSNDTKWDDGKRAWVSSKSDLNYLGLEFIFVKPTWMLLPAPPVCTSRKVHAGPRALLYEYWITYNILQKNCEKIRLITKWVNNFKITSWHQNAGSERINYVKMLNDYYCLLWLLQEKLEKIWFSSF